VNPISTELALAGAFGVVFVVTLLVLAIKFPRPTAFQYMVFRVILAIAVAGIAPFIPGLLQVEAGTSVKAGGAIAVFVIVYFFSPAKLVLTNTQVDLPALVRAWEGVRAPNVAEPAKDLDMAHRALNAMKLVSWYWKNGSKDEKQLIRAESFAPYEQWFSVLDSNPIQMSDGKSSKEHLADELQTTYLEMKSHA
jgi:hypothetical protein